MNKFTLLVCIILPFVFANSLQDFGAYDYDDDLVVNNSSKRIGMDPKIVMTMIKQRLLKYFEFLRLQGTLQRPTRKKYFPFHPLVRFRPTSLPDSPQQEEEEELDPPERTVEEEPSVNAAEMLSALNAILSGRKPTTIGGEEEIKSLRYGLSK